VIKAELDQVRERAEAAGFDLPATLRESLTGTFSDKRPELDTLERTNQIRTADMVTSAIDHGVTTARRGNAL
jgi:hypothetical protein